jgi:uncharacterized adenine-specific methylase MG184
MGRNSELNRARVGKNDEFYTDMSDVSKEMVCHRERFRGKTVFLNCDDPVTSAFWEYFHLNFGFLGLRRLIATHYDKDKPTYKLEYFGGDDNEVLVGDKEALNGNGDFRNEECIELLRESDIVVTNPPFSLFREFIGTLIEYEKKFIILGNMNAVTAKEVFDLFREKIRCGTGIRFTLGTGGFMCQRVIRSTRLGVESMRMVDALYELRESVGLRIFPLNVGWKSLSCISSIVKPNIRSLISLM